MAILPPTQSLKKKKKILLCITTKTHDLKKLPMEMQRVCTFSLKNNQNSIWTYSEWNWGVSVTRSWGSLKARRSRLWESWFCSIPKSRQAEQIHRFLQNVSILMNPHFPVEKYSIRKFPTCPTINQLYYGIYGQKPVNSTFKLQNLKKCFFKANLFIIRIWESFNKD